MDPSLTLSFQNTMENNQIFLDFCSIFGFDSAKSQYFYFFKTNLLAYQVYFEYISFIDFECFLDLVK
jgi:hypothetical protein